MKDTANAALTQMLDQSVAIVQGRQHEEKQMSRLLAAGGDIRQLDRLRAGPVGQFCGIAVPECSPPGLNGVGHFQLRIKKSRQRIRRQVTRAEINPSVFVDLPAKKAA